MGHEVESMAYAVTADGRGVPWHGLGTPMQDGMTIAQALDAVPEVGTEVEPWYVEAVNPNNPDERIRIDAGTPIGGYVANVRREVIGPDGVKPRAVVGLVTDTYELAQTREQVEAVQVLVDERDLVVETAISLRGGRAHAVLLRMPEAVKFAGDDVLPYCLVSNSFDGSRALTFAATPIRVVCANTERLALDGTKTTRQFQVRHGKGLSEKIDDARRALGFADDYIAALAARADVLAARKVDASEIVRLLRATFPDPVRRPNEDGHVFDRRTMKAREAQIQVRELIRTADNLAEHRDNAWGYLQGVVEWEDHVLNGMGTPRDADATRSRAERRMMKVALAPAVYAPKAERAIRSLLLV